MRRVDKIILAAGLIVIFIFFSIIAIQVINSKPLPEWLILFPFVGGALCGISSRYMIKNKLNKQQVFLLLGIIFLIMILLMIIIRLLFGIIM